MSGEATPTVVKASTLCGSEPHTIPAKQSVLKKIHKTKVDNIGFLIDRLGQDCGPLQWCRELTQNSIEACKRAILNGTCEEGRIIWHIANVMVGGKPVRKLAIADNGDGMTGKEMNNRINSLSSSIADQALDGNYGVGAKIAAATRNHHGLFYLSWKNDEGACVQLIKDEKGEYGLNYREFGDGEFHYILPIPSNWPIPGIIPNKKGVKNGTQVVLFGNTASQKTYEPPPEMPTGHWISKYLNTRYFRFPNKIRIQAVRIATGEGDVIEGGLSPVRGQEFALNTAAGKDRGTVQLTGAIAHWWALPDREGLVNAPTDGIKSMKSLSTDTNVTGHVAFLYQDELYDTLIGKAGVAMLHRFGVLFGENRVVIYIAPTDKDVITDIAREHLVLKGGGLLARERMEDWAEEFRSKMPTRLHDFIESIGTNTEKAQLTDAMWERLQKVVHLLPTFGTGFIRSPRSRKHEADPENKIGEIKISHDGRDEGAVQPPGRGPGRPRPNESGSETVDLFGYKQEGESSKKVRITQPVNRPKVTWQTIEDGTRAEGSMEARAATYIDAPQNHLLINEDFVGFTAWVDAFARMYPESPGARGAIKNIVKQWWELLLVEAVLIYPQYKGLFEWFEKEEDHMDEYLTMAVIGRYHFQHVLKREIHQALGKALGLPIEANPKDPPLFTLPASPPPKTPATEPADAVT